MVLNPTSFVEVRLPLVAESRKLLQMRAVGNIAFTVETFNPKNRSPVQCFRCLGWGHMASLCNMKVRCLLCSEEHSYKVCQLNTSTSNFRCANCDGPHKANDPTCSALKAYLGKKISTQEAKEDKTKTPSKKKDSAQPHFDARFVINKKQGKRNRRRARGSRNK